MKSYGLYRPFCPSHEKCMNEFVFYRPRENNTTRTRPKPPDLSTRWTRPPAAESARNWRSANSRFGCTLAKISLTAIKSQAKAAATCLEGGCPRPATNVGPREFQTRRSNASQRCDRYPKATQWFPTDSTQLQVVSPSGTIRRDNREFRPRTRQPAR